MKKVYTIYDRDAGEAGPLFQAVNDKVAARGFRHAMLEAVADGDFQLMCVGEFNEEKPEIIGTPLRVVPVSKVEEE